MLSTACVIIEFCVSEGYPFVQPPSGHNWVVVVQIVRYVRSRLVKLVDWSLNTIWSLTADLSPLLGQATRISYAEMFVYAVSQTHSTRIRNTQTRLSYIHVLYLYNRPGNVSTAFLFVSCGNYLDVSLKIYTCTCAHARCKISLFSVCLRKMWAY